MMFHSSEYSQRSEMSLLLDRLAQASTRPRYAFMVLSLIAEVSDSNGEAGPFVHRNGHALCLRDFLCDSLAPLGARDARRVAMVQRVQCELPEQGALPADRKGAAAIIEDEIRKRIRVSGKTNLSRAVSELVKAGLLDRYYKGFAVDHENRGGQRHAVYILQGLARCLLAARMPAAQEQSAMALLV
jgi:hypothetical protein